MHNFNRVCGREFAVMHGAVPKALMEEEVISCVVAASQNLVQGGGDGEWIVEYAVGVEVAIEVGLLQTLPHLRGKAGAHQQQLLALVYPRQLARPFNGCREVYHRNKLSWIFASIAS